MLFPQNNRIRQTIDLSGMWDFFPDPKKVGEIQEWYKGLPDSVTLAVPGSWNDQLSNSELIDDTFDIHNFTGVSWYQKKFFIPEDWTNRRIWFRVGGVYRTQKIWLNGKFVGDYDVCFLPSEFEITEYIIPGKENSLTILVSAEIDKCSLPTDREYQVYQTPHCTFDWFPYGGIHRPVTVYSTGKSIIEDIKVEPSLDKATGILDYTVTVNGDALSVKITLEGHGFTETQSGTVIDNTLTGRFIVKNASFWSPESPALYDLKVELIKEDRILDQYILPVGIRTVSILGFELLLNGKPVYLRGTGKHEDFPIAGKGLYNPVIVKDFSLLKWLGANCVRCCHYPYSDEFLYMADREGILLIDEIPAYQFAYYQLSDEFYKNHQKAVKDMISRDKNHPSVIIWCIANEPQVNKTQNDFPTEGIVEYFKNICGYAKTLDTRPVTVASCYYKDWTILEFCDIAFLNRYYGWYEFSGNMERGTEFLISSLEEFHEHLNMPFVISEFGAEAFAGLHSYPGEMWTEEYQTEFLRKTMETIHKYPFIVGELVWSFADFKVAQSYHRVTCNRKGIFTRDREPKMSAHMIRSLWKGKVNK